MIWTLGSLYFFATLLSNSLMIGDDIKIVFLGGSKNHTRVMLDIPKEINVVRSKVMEANATDPKKRDNLAHYYAVPELPEKYRKKRSGSK